MKALYHGCKRFHDSIGVRCAVSENYTDVSIEDLETMLPNNFEIVIDHFEIDHSRIKLFKFITTETAQNSAKQRRNIVEIPQK